MAVFVSFKDAVRFTNWLHNGQGSGDTEAWAYAITVGNDEVHSASATYLLPSPDEWHKAAYHKNDGLTSNFWFYPTSKGTLDLISFQPDVPIFSDQQPGADAPDSANRANIRIDDVNDLNGYNDGYASTGSSILVDGQNYRTNLGA